MLDGEVMLHWGTADAGGHLYCLGNTRVTLRVQETKIVSGDDYWGAEEGRRLCSPELGDACAPDGI